MILIIGLGNPGKQYEASWHNLGFLALEKFGIKNNFTEFKLENKFKAELAQKVGDEKIILVKPQTFMNASGTAVKLLVNFYKVNPADIIIIHDDIDLPLGKIRICKNASAAGHKGVQSIIDELSSKNLIRIRLGIQSVKQGRIPIEDYVLQKFDKTDKVVVEKMIQKVTEALPLILAGKISEAMNRFN